MKTTCSNLFHALLWVLLLAIALPGYTANAVDSIHPVTLAENNTPERMQFSAMGRDFTLLLNPSRYNDVSVFYNGNASQDNVASSGASATKVFEGIVAGDAQSWARITVSNNLPSGYIKQYGQLFRLAPWHEVADLLPLTHKPGELVLIDTTTTSSNFSTRRNFSKRPIIDVVRSAPQPNPATQSSANKDAALSLSIQNRSNLGQAVTRAIRVGIVVDSRFNEEHNQRGLARALSIINAVDGIYQDQLGVAVELESIRVFDNPDTDPMRNLGGTVDDILNNFRQVRIDDERLSPDLTMVHLFTGHRDPEAILGLGWLDTACRVDGFDLSVSTPYPFATLLTAHEMAHNLGAVHDDDPRCEAFGLSDRNTLMWSNISGNTTNTFSACSLQSMQASIQASCNLDNIDMALSLRTIPSNESLQRSILIEVGNTDFARTARNVSSTTTFPDGTALTELSAGCVAEQNRLRCNHGDIGAAETRQAQAVATLPNFSRDDVQSELELPNSADVNQANNRAVLRMLNPITTEPDPVLLVNDPGNNQQVTIATANNPGNSGGATETAAAKVGAVSRWVLLVLLTFVFVAAARMRQVKQRF